MSKETIISIFEGHELSEEFKTKALAIFEAQIDERVTAKEEELQKVYEEKVESKIKELEELSETYIEENILPEIDRYLTIAVSEWLEENKIALDTGAKVTMAESFIEGMKNLLAEHDLEVAPVIEEKVIDLESKKQALENVVVEQKEQISALKESIKAMEKDKLIDEATKNLSFSQKDKIAPVISKVEFKDNEQFTAAINSIVESFFPVDVPVDQIKEEKEVIKEESKKVEDPYLQSLFAGLKQ